MERLSPYKGRLFPCKERLSLYKERLFLCKERLSPYKGRLSPYKGRLSLCKGRLSLHKGRPSLCKERLSHYKRRLSLCKGRLSPYKERLLLYKGRLFHRKENACGACLPWILNRSGAMDWNDMDRSESDVPRREGRRRAGSKIAKGRGVNPCFRKSTFALLCDLCGFAVELSLIPETSRKSAGSPGGKRLRGAVNSGRHPPIPPPFRRKSRPAGARKRAKRHTQSRRAGAGSIPKIWSNRSPIV